MLHYLFDAESRSLLEGEHRAEQVPQVPRFEAALIVPGVSNVWFNLLFVFAPEREVPGCQNIEDNPEAPNVSFFVIWHIADNLWGAILEGATPVQGLLSWHEDGWQTEIYEFHCDTASWGVLDHYIVKLDVSVCDSQAVHELDPLGNFFEYLFSLLFTKFHTPLIHVPHVLTQRDAIYVFHHNIQFVLLLEDVD